MIGGVSIAVLVCDCTFDDAHDSSNLSKDPI